MSGNALNSLRAAAAHMQAGRGGGVPPPSRQTTESDGCPVCNSSSTACTDSRRSSTGRRRRRACGSCGHRWTTWEVPFPAAAAVKTVVEALDRTMADLGELRAAMASLLSNVSDDAASSAAGARNETEERPGKVENP